MIVVLFRSKHVDEPAGYAEMAEEMDALGTRGDAARVARERPPPLRPATGRERWCQYYKLDVAEVARATAYGRRDPEVTEPS